ncbi:MAG TPA: sigma-70 family RNA polymerase sigma factor [Cyclobacteriaceae bacterium]|nr:sigma-70 family RNA polymerase sigma factor [Cyclobacteriaceae bacterium]
MKQDIRTDNQLINEEGVIKGSQENPENFRPLYEKYFRTIFLFILHRVEQKEIAADLTSQVFLKSLMNIARYKFKGLPFSAWLYRIAINECNDYFRKNKRERMVVLEDHMAENLYEAMFDDDTRDELKDKLPLVFERLRPDELQLIELRFLENRPFIEVANILEITENNAKVKTYRVLDKMKKLLISRLT